MKNRGLIFTTLVLVIVIGLSACAPVRPGGGEPKLTLDDLAEAHEINIAYDDGPKYVYDVFYDPAVENAKVIVMVHGGGMTKEDMYQRVPIYTDLGYVVVDVEFSREQDNGILGSMQNIACATRHFMDNADKYNADPSQLIYHGFSGGGHKGGRMIYDQETDWLENCPVQGEEGNWIGYIGEGTNFGIADLPDEEITENELGFITAPIDFIESRPDIYNDNVANQPHTGAINFLDTDDPPALLIHGTKDPVSSHKRAVEFEAALNEVGIPVKLFSIQGGGHGNKIWNRPLVVDEIVSFTSAQFEGEAWP